jgi:hypothetical protein
MPSDTDPTGQSPRDHPDYFVPRALYFLNRQLVGRMLQEYGPVVQTGPFEGMKYVTGTVANSLVPMLLGSYEANLHPIIEDIIRRAPEEIVNIGCGEGYYAVGFARRLAASHIYAFEAESKARSECNRMAQANEVASRITIRGTCTLEDLRPLCASAPLIFCDCEGAELELLDPTQVPQLAACEILVELHDFANPAITPTIIERFTPTHEVNVMLDTGRNVHAYPSLRKLTDLFQLLAVCEGRPESMSWAHLRPRKT